MNISANMKNLQQLPAEENPLKAATETVMREQNVGENSVSHGHKVSNNSTKASQKQRNQLPMNRSAPAIHTVQKSGNAVDQIPLWYTWE